MAASRFTDLQDAAAGVLASSVDESPLHRSVVTFEVAVQFLERHPRGGDGWSEPVQFRFVQRDDEQWDLVMRRVEKRGGELARVTELRRAIAEMRDAREIHALWVAGLRDGSIDRNAPAKTVEVSGGIQHHEEWIRRYDRVIRLLEAEESA